MRREPQLEAFLARRSTFSLPGMPQWLGIQKRRIEWFEEVRRSRLCLILKMLDEEEEIKSEQLEMT